MFFKITFHGFHLMHFQKVNKVFQCIQVANLERVCVFVGVCVCARAHMCGRTSKFCKTALDQEFTTKAVHQRGNSLQAHSIMSKFTKSR